LRVSDVLREVGRPVAYYPGLVKHLGSVKATVLFCQIFYWQDKATSELGVHKTTDELRDETGLTYEEQRAARTELKRLGVLIETAKRIEHKIYFRIDEDALERLVESADETLPADPADAQTVDVALEREKSTSPNGKSPSREIGKVQPGKREKSTPPNGQIPVREGGFGQVVNRGKTTAEITAESSSNAHAHEAVDNSPPKPLLPLPDDQKSKPTAEQSIVDLLQTLELGRGKRCAIDGAKDRVHVLTWVGRGVTLDQLRESHRRAVAARDRDQDGRPVNAGFLARFVDEVLAMPTAAATTDDGTPWFESIAAEVIDAKGAELGVRPRKPDEAIASYRVLVVNASKEKSAVDFVLRDAKKFNDQRLYEFAVATFGDALMPTDFYA
jgi:hypothetical protein